MGQTKTNAACLDTDSSHAFSEANRTENSASRDVNYFSIKEIEALTGVKAHTIRIWEQRYEMVTPKRTDTNIRYYDEQDLRKLLNVALLNKNGYKISEIAGLTEQDIRDRVMQLAIEKNDHENQLQALTLSMLELNEQAFEKLLSTAFLQMGIEKTMIQVVFPFFKSIGIMWQTGSINPAHEHFITNIVRQKLVVAIDGQNARLDGWSKKYMLFLPEGEFHEIGLLFANYAIRARGHHVIYIGANVPYPDLKVVYDVYRPEVLFTILTSPMAQVQPQAYLDSLSKDFPASTILTSGMLLLNEKDLKVPANVRLMQDFKEMLSLVSELN